VAAAEHLLGAVLIVPEARLGNRFFESNEFLPLRLDVKETSAARRREISSLRIALLLLLALAYNCHQIWFETASMVA
jgi:hypothetical protein